MEAVRSDAPVLARGAHNNRLAPQLAEGSLREVALRALEARLAAMCSNTSTPALVEAVAQHTPGSVSPQARSRGVAVRAIGHRFDARPDRSVYDQQLPT